VDAAVQSKLLGAQDVHMVYRRWPDAMTASKAEQEWAQTHGVSIHHWLAPIEILPNTLDPQSVGAVRFARQMRVNGQLVSSSETVVIEADMVLKAIGQTLGNPLLAEAGFEMDAGRIATDANGLTNQSGIWAGGDCRAGGLDLTVEAVAHGKQSAQAIHTQLMNT
jgi:dihydropyrimidine dehydrogenase (NAD+) subunit PreT